MNVFRTIIISTHSPLIAGMTIALLSSLGTFIVRKECVGIYFACTKDYSISPQKRLSRSSMRVHVSGAQFSLWRTNNFVFLKFSQCLYLFEQTKKSIQDVIGDVYCPPYPNEKCIHLSTNKSSNFYDCKKWKACYHVLNFPLQDQKPTFMSFGGDDTHCFARETSRD